MPKNNWLTLSQQRLNGGSALIIAAGISSGFNFLYNAFLSRALPVEAFGVVALLGSFATLASIPFGALSTTMSHRSAQRHTSQRTAPRHLWTQGQLYAFPVGLVATVVWLAATPLLRDFFQSSSLLPWLLFTPVWVAGLALAVTSGWLSGTAKFPALAAVVATEAISKWAIAVGLVHAGYAAWVYAAAPAGLIISLLVGWLIITKLSSNQSRGTSLPAWPRRFLATATLGQLATVAILSLDIILAKYFLPPTDAGRYALLSLTGKMVFFLGTLFSQFIIPLVSRETQPRVAAAVGNRLLVAVGLALTAGFAAFGLLGFVTVPLLFGTRAVAIVPLLPTYTLAMAYFGIVTSLTAYHQARKHYGFPIVASIVALLPAVGILVFHDSPATFAVATLGAATVGLAITVFAHWIYQNIPAPMQSGPARILIFNWRDTKHVWSGGAEVYLHELATRWVKAGHTVTLFCGNDGKSKRRERVHGIEVIRRGGFYLVYPWAFFYYWRYFRGKYDVIIDSANGIPFFTPLYAREPVHLLIHHVHQEIFRQSLRPPLSWLALFLERRLMPLVYRRTPLVTVSPSSKADILAHRLTKHIPAIVYNGVDSEKFHPGQKSAKPLVLYLGRLKEYKSVPVFLQAALRVLEKVPQAEFVIAGDGEERSHLQTLAKKLNLRNRVRFLGQVTEAQKVRLLQRAWVFVNPSLMEGWGITTIEANACGTPVVASRVAGLKDSVRNPHTGFLVPYGDVVQFADKITDLLTNNQRREIMSQEAISWAKGFDWQTSADTFLHTIKKSL